MRKLIRNWIPPTCISLSLAAFILTTLKFNLFRQKYPIEISYLINNATSKPLSFAQTPKLGWPVQKPPPEISTLINEAVSNRNGVDSDDFSGPFKRDWHFTVQRTSVRGIERNGIGYKKGYSSFDGLIAPYASPGHVLPLIDVRGHHLYVNQYATNLGIVARYIPVSSCRIWGANTYYDFRQGKLGNYHQFGFGAELLSRKWDARLNVYLPFEDKSHSTKCEIRDCRGNIFAIFRRVEFDFKGLNAEAGLYMIRGSQFRLYGAAGPYYLTGRCAESWGVKGRMRFQYREFLALEITVSHDDIFKTNYQAEIISSLPLYQLHSKKHKKPLRCISERQIYQPVQRFEIIPIKLRQGCDHCCRDCD